MKTKQIFILVMAALTLGACSESFLERYPDGSTLTQEQYDQQPDALAGTALSIYPPLYAWGGDGHDEFGERSIDMYGDLLSGDMALNSNMYGWFEVDARGMTRAYRAGYIWSHYYYLIRLCNLAINAAEKQGIPEIPESSDADIAETDAKRGFYYGQFLTLRGYAYASLMQWFMKTSEEVIYAEEKAIPIYDEVYTETDATTGAPRAYAEDVYKRIEADLTTAVDYLAGFDAYVGRSSKLEVDADVARNLLAYAYLNWGDHDADALKYAKEVIDGGNFQILPNAEVLTNGFNNVNTKSWMWGQDVTIENYTALPSFFGQVDVYTYSYASAGDIKGIDDILLAEITAMGWDIREEWFAPKGTKNAEYAPWKKFFSATSTKFQGDREWLSDNVFMRIESAYLIAAEAAYKTGDLAGAVTYLDAIMSQRLKDNATAKEQYEAYKATLKTDVEVENAIIYNWRVEMWGEGYGLDTFRRLHKSKTLGKNQFRQDETINSGDDDFKCNIPSSEYRYNSSLNAETNLEQAD